MSEHTPGPWRVFTARGNRHKIIGIGEMTGEGITDCGFGVWRGGSAEAVANANLIAAAPELFILADHPVMEWLLGEGLSTIPEPQQTSVRLFLVPLRDAAIAKAKGRA